MHYFKKLNDLAQNLFICSDFILASHYYVLNLIILRILYLMLVVMKFNNIKKKLLKDKNEKLGLQLNLKILLNFYTIQDYKFVCERPLSIYI